MIFRKVITSKISSQTWSTPLSGHFLFHVPQRYNLHRKSLVSRVHYVHHGCIFVAIVPRAGWNHSRIEPHHMRTWTQCKIRKEKNRHSHWKMHRVNDVFQIWLCSQVTHTHSHVMHFLRPARPLSASHLSSRVVVVVSRP